MFILTILAGMVLHHAEPPTSRDQLACDRTLSRVLDLPDRDRDFRIIIESTGQDCQTAMATIRVVDEAGRIWVSDGFPLEGPSAHPVQTVEDADTILLSGITNGLIVDGNSLPVRLPQEQMYEEYYIWNILHPEAYDRAREANWPILCWSHHYEQSHCAAFDLDAGYAFVLFSSGV